MRGRALRPTTAAPSEMKWWNRLSLILLTGIVVLGVLTTNHLVAGALVILLGAVQVGFGAALAVNRRGFAKRLAEYAAHRPLMLGGGPIGRGPFGQRTQGLAMTFLGAALIAFGIGLIVA